MERSLLLSFEDVWKVYRSGRIEYPALRGLSLKVMKGERVAIVGPSGSGKSTFLHIAGALDRPTRGRVFFNGIDISRLPDSELSSIRNRSIGFIFQSFNLVNRLSALENVELPLTVRGVSGEARRGFAKEALRLVGLEGKEGRKPTELSGGEQQRVAIARAIAGRPELVLADEPTGNLDSVNTKAIVELLVRLNRELGTTIVVVTHNMDVASAANRVLWIRDGRLEREVLNNA
ncbi:MAG: ABC transporter ATP-binding protein [Nitrososphaerota archaeon]|nr:ABC transporter ATP-binding protein [Nitrososphaerota archaeon]